MKKCWYMLRIQFENKTPNNTQTTLHPLKQETPEINTTIKKCGQQRVSIYQKLVSTNTPCMVFNLETTADKPCSYKVQIRWHCTQKYLSSTLKSICLRVCWIFPFPIKKLSVWFPHSSSSGRPKTVLSVNKSTHGNICRICSAASRAIVDD